MLHAEPTNKPYVFILSIPYIARRDTFQLFSFDKFPVKVRNGNTTNNAMVVESLPIYIANFALDYGTGVVMADAHDQRDFEFAKK